MIIIENVWAGFNNIFRAFFISYFENKKKWDFAAESHFIIIYSPFFYACTRSLILWCVIFYTKAKSYKNILATKFWRLESNSSLFNVLLILQ